MKLEKLGRKKKSKILIGVVVFLCFISVIIYTGSRAKYKVTESIPLVNGTINYKPYDFKMMAMYQANNSGGYTEIEVMPTSGYEINEEKSYCTTDNVNKDTTAKLFTNSQGQHVIENLKKNDKCYIWFDVLQKSSLTSTQRIHEMGLSATSGATSFTGVSTSNEGLKIGEDDDGITYYFRGNVTNNWVQFAGVYWRIIRINGDGSIRLIYNGISTNKGSGTNISTSAYNSLNNDNAYVGYMYGSIGANTYTATHANTNSSTIKKEVDNWYMINIKDADYEKYISKEAGFCNDRSIANDNENWWEKDTKKGYGTNATAYGMFNRVMTSTNSWKTSQTPSFKCPNASTDLFTAIESTKGNKKLIYPIGLITSDEVIFAGSFNKSNINYYLHTTQNYWTMTPWTLYYTDGITYAFYVHNSGQNGYLNVGEQIGVRPVINLSSDVKLSGNGTTSDPYKIAED